MKIKKFEKYEFDYEDDIGDEYAKYIISKFIDEGLDGKTLQDVYNDVVKRDDLEDHEEHVLESVKVYIKNLSILGGELVTKLKSEAKKYNL